MHKCVYCGNEAFYQFKNGKWCCSKNMNGCPAIKEQRKKSAIKLWEELHSQNKTQLKQLDIKKPVIDQTHCFYCGGPANYQLKNGKWCCCESANSCPVNREKNSVGVNKAYDSGLESRKHFTKESRWKQGTGNRGKTKENNESAKRRSELMKDNYRSGKIKSAWIGRKHTPDEIDKIMLGMNTKRIKLITSGYKGWYKGYWCDSSWELAFVMYNLDHNIIFERNNKGFDYEFEGKHHRFYPDFKYEDGTYVEIKGKETDKDRIKIDTFKYKDKFIVLKRKEMQKYLDYAREKYGQDFYKLYEEKNTNLV